MASTELMMAAALANLTEQGEGDQERKTKESF